jgi:hypothetical protein
MAFCPDCGKPYPDQATKCGSCGKELPAAAKKPVGGKFKGTMLMTPAAGKQFAGAGAVAQPPGGPPVQPAQTPAPVPQPAGQTAGEHKASADQMAFGATVLMSATPLPGSLQKPVVTPPAAAEFKGKGTILAAVAPPVAMQPSAPAQTPQAPAQPAPLASPEPTPHATQPSTQAARPAPMNASGGESFNLRRPIAADSAIQQAGKKRLWIGLALGFVGLLAIFAAIGLLLR